MSAVCRAHLSLLQFGSLAYQQGNVIDQLHFAHLFPCSESLDSLRSVIDKSKGLKISSVRPLVLAAEENLHNMVVDLDKMVMKVKFVFSFLVHYVRLQEITLIVSCLLPVCWLFASFLNCKLCECDSSMLAFIGQYQT